MSLHIFRNLMIASLTAAVCLVGCADSNKSKKRIHVGSRAPVEKSNKNVDVKADGTPEVDGDTKALPERTSDQKKTDAEYEATLKQLNDGTVLTLADLKSGTYTLDGVSTELVVNSLSNGFIKIFSAFETPSEANKNVVVLTEGTSEESISDAGQTLDIAKSFTLVVTDKDIKSADASYINLVAKVNLTKLTDLKTSDKLSAVVKPIVNNLDYIVRGDMSDKNENMAAATDVEKALGKESHLNIIKLADGRIRVLISIVQSSEITRNIFAIYKVEETAGEPAVDAPADADADAAADDKEKVIMEGIGN